MATHASARAEWVPAPLFSTSGIRGTEEQERRAASALLSVMRAVPSFGRTVVAHAGAPRGNLSTFAEVQLRSQSGLPCRPDGAIVVERGRTTWTCLVEVKTGSAEVDPEQVMRYIEAARELRLDAVLSISNQIPASGEDVPFSVDRRRVGRIKLLHLPWWQIVTDAIVEHRHRGVSDLDQAWILGELVAYLTHENSGATGMRDMGREWVAVREGARQGTVRSNDPAVREVAERWLQLVRFLCLGFSQELGSPVHPVRKRRETDADRIDGLIRSLVDEGKLHAAVRVPDAVSDIAIEADVRLRTVSYSVTVEAPGDHKAQGRIGWLMRQLKDAPDDLRIDVAFAGSRETASIMLGEARDNPRGLLLNSDPRREQRTFRITSTRPMGLRRGRDGDSFVTETRRQAIAFYRDLVQNLRPWQRRPPRLTTETATEDVAPEDDAVDASLRPTEPALRSQEEPEASPGEPRTPL